MNGGAASSVWKAAIDYMLSNYQYNDAVFLAERLYDQDKSASNGYILATCYYRSGCIQQAKFLCSTFLDQCHLCVLLYARCCLALKQYVEGLHQLKGLFQVTGIIDFNDIKKRFGDDVGVAFCLLGDINRKLNLHNEAARMYQLALQCNPLLWSAFESLCQLGKADLSAEDYLKCDEVPPFLRQRLANSSHNHGTLVKPTSHESSCLDLFKTGLTGSSTPASAIVAPSRGRHPLLSFDNSKGMGGSFSLADSSPQGILDFSSPIPQFSLNAPSKQDKTRLADCSLGPRPSVLPPSTTPGVKPLEMGDLITPIPQKIEDTGFTPSLVTPSSTASQGHSTPEQSVAHSSPPRTAGLRRSARLGGGGVGKSPSSMRMSRHRSEIIPLTQSRSKVRFTKSPILKKRVKFVGKNPQKPHPLSSANPQENEDPSLQQTADFDDKMDTNIQKEETEEEDKLLIATRGVVNTLALFGTAYRYLLNYQLKEAVSSLSALPVQFKSSSWVLTHLGHAMMAMEKFTEAVKYYKSVHSFDPHRQEGMDQYGAGLWHLQKVSDLETLVEDLQSSDKLKPEGLCALSSLMNIHKEHEAAILYLERAIQLSPHYVYAHTLLGLEHILIKDYEKANTAFQSAISINPRHFKAWYGMGHLFLKQEKWLMAEIYSRKAVEINPSSSVAFTQLALILQHQGKLSQALQMIQHAILLNPTNNLPKFYRAQILESLDNNNEALMQLQELTSSLPREPLFYKIMSRILMKVGKPHEAVLRMSWSLDYAHSARGMIGGGGVVMTDRGDLNQMIDGLPGLDDNDFVVHSDDDISDS